MTLRPTVALAALAALLAMAACDGGKDPEPSGQESFVSRPGSASRAGTVGAEDGAGGPSTAAPGATSGTGSGSGATASRAVEESDVYRRSGDLLHVLNGYRGLVTVSLADPANPRILSRLPVTGTPVDLYLRGTTAFVLVSDAFAYLPLADGTGARPERTSRLLAVDLADPAAPRVVGDLAIDGQIETSRLVGDALYVVSHRWSWYGWGLPMGGGVVATDATGSIAAGETGPFAPPAAGADAVVVASFDVSDPAHPAAVDSLALSAVGWSVHAHATASRITLSLAGYEQTGGTWGPVTWFAPVDVSDAGGALAVGTAFSAPGTVQDRWAMDLDEAAGHFRAVLSDGWNVGATLRTWTSPTPAVATPLSSLKVEVPEGLTAARFDGSRVYLVTAVKTDPLWAIDASDPAVPRLVGQLEMPGQLDYIEPRGDRLLALGHTGEAGTTWQLAASLIDVSDLATPRLLSRVTFGSAWGWTGASADDLRKVFLVFDPPPASIGLVLVPSSGWDTATWALRGGVQLIDWSGDALTLRGALSHPGAPRRAFPLDASGARLVAFSDQVLQVIDAADRGAPAELARIDLARPVQEVAVMPGALVELCGDWSRGDTEVVVTPLSDPDAPIPLARLSVPAPMARSFRVGDVLWLLATHWSSGTGWLEAVDLSDPLHPARRGKLPLSASDSTTARGGWWGYGSEAALVGSVLAIHQLSWPECRTSPCVPVDELRLYDLSDPDHPHLASTVRIPGSAWSWGLAASGRHLWLTHFEWGPDQATVADGTAWGRYWLDRIDVTDPAHPVQLNRVNVPGIFAGASEDGRTFLTLEPTWSGSTTTTQLHELALTSAGTARLVGTATLDGYPSGVVRAGNHAYLATTDWSEGTTRVRIHAVELDGVTVTSTQAVDGYWAWAATAAGGKLFLQAGWQDQGVLVYDLADPARPAFQRFVRTEGWVQQIAVGGGVAYLPAGAYGVTMIDLDE